MRTIAVASGKGGVGKTTLTANLGVAMAEAGSRVVLFDADFGLANLDIALGLKSDTNVQHVIEGIVSLPQAAVPGPVGTRVITGSSGVSSMLRLSRKRLEVLLNNVTELESTTDVLIFDAASGADAKIMTILKAADRVVLVTTPDPASVVDCYSTAKVLFRYKKDAVIDIIVNMAQDEDQGRKAFETIESATTKFLHKSVSYLGCVREDDNVIHTASKRRPFVLENAGSVAAGDVTKIANKLLNDGLAEQHLNINVIMKSA